MPWLSSGDPRGPRRWTTSPARPRCRGRSCRWSCTRAPRCHASAASACSPPRPVSATGPTPSRAASRAAGPTRSGVLLDDLHNPYFAEIAGGIEDHASSLGYRVLLCTGGRRVARERVDARRAARVPDGRDHPGEPAAAVGRDRRGDALGARWSSSAGRCATAAVDCVNTDEGMGARLAVEHLVGLGHRRIVHVDGGPGTGAAPRRAGFEQAMRDAGLADHARIVPGEFTEAAGVRAVERLLEGPEPLPDRGLLGQRPAGRRRPRPPRGRRRPRPRGRLDRRLRQHLPRRAAPHVADLGQPAAPRDGPPGARAAARARGGTPRADGAADRPDPRRAAHLGPAAVGGARALLGVASSPGAAAPPTTVPSPSRVDVGRADAATGFVAGPGRVVTVAHVVGGRPRRSSVAGGARAAGAARGPPARPRRARGARARRRARAAGRGSGPGAPARPRRCRSAGGSPPACASSAARPFAERRALELGADVSAGDSGAPVLTRRRRGGRRGLRAGARAARRRLCGRREWRGRGARAALSGACACAPLARDRPAGRAVITEGRSEGGGAGGPPKTASRGYSSAREP